MKNILRVVELVYEQDNKEMEKTSYSGRVCSIEGDIPFSHLSFSEMMDFFKRKAEQDEEENLK